MIMPTLRRELEILLDRQDRRDYVVSAYLDLRRHDGFRTDAAQHLRGELQQADAALSAAEASAALAANAAAIEQAIARVDPAARGLAVFSGAARGLLHVVPLDFPVENMLVLDEDPFVLPLLERWSTTPRHLIARVGSRDLSLFEAHAGVPELVERVERDLPPMQRDKPRFTYKKRFAQTWHEFQQPLDNDGFLKGVAETIGGHYTGADFDGLILLGTPHLTAAVRRLLDRRVQDQIVEVGSQPDTTDPADVADDVARAVDAWRAGREAELLAELTGRWQQRHHVADGPTEVLDALQQGRATQVVVGGRRDLAGAVCRDCRYRFGAALATCLYCGGLTRTVNAVQEILRLALRHRVGVYLIPTDRAPDTDPIAKVGGVCALTRAEANWAPDLETAAASQGH